MPNKMKYIARGPFCFGISTTSADDAVTLLKRNVPWSLIQGFAQVEIFQTPDLEAGIDGDGAIRYSEKYGLKLVETIEIARNGRIRK